MDDEVGNRFYPTDEQIISYYLEGKMQGMNFPGVIGEVDICKYEPWELPAQAAWQSEDPVWFFFAEPDYKYANSSRINRTTAAGYWKPTGRERAIRDNQYGREIGTKKNLVFHQGRFKKGVKTEWVIHEFHSHRAKSYQKPYVLCRLKQKSNGNVSDGCEGPSSNQMASQGNPQMSNVEEPLPSLSQTDYDFLSETMSQMNQTAPGYYNSTWSNYEPYSWTRRFHINTPEQGDWLKFERSVNTEFPVDSLRQVYTNDSSYTGTEMGYLQWRNVLDTPSFLIGNASRTNYRKICMFPAPESKKRRINYIPLLTKGIPNEKPPPKKLHLQSKASDKAMSRTEATENAKLDNDLGLTQKLNSRVKYVHNQSSAQSAKKSSKMTFDGFEGSRKGCIIFLQTPPLDPKQNQTTVFSGNVLIAVILLLLILKEMESFH